MISRREAARPRRVLGGRQAARLAINLRRRQGAPLALTLNVIFMLSACESEYDNQNAKRVTYLYWANSSAHFDIKLEYVRVTGK
jgi:hypothetical protein